MEVPATSQGIDQVLAAQQAALASHEEGIRALQANQQTVLTQQSSLAEQLRSQGDCLRELADSLRRLAVAATPETRPTNHTAQPDPLPVKEPKLQLPLRYAGESGKCRGFLSQCLIFFKAQPSRFASHDSRVAFILSLLTGTALAWADPLIRANAPIMNNADRLMEEMAVVFDHDISGQEAAMKLTRLRQGRESVATFSITFRALAGETGWSEGPLISMFLNALADPIKDALAVLEPPVSFDALVSTAIRIDNRIREREREKGEKKDRSRRYFHSLEDTPPAPSLTHSPARSEEAMQVDSSTLRNCPIGSRTEWCRYCRRKGHTKDQCPKLSGNDKPR